MNAARFLDALGGVKQTGNGRWLAKCPAHDDSSPSLSIRELDDGRILIHDFAGCGTDAVLDALGLTLADLFPESIGNCTPTKSRAPAADVLAAVAHEVDVAAIITARISDTRHIQDSDLQRLALCAARIGGAVHGR